MNGAAAPGTDVRLAIAFGNREKGTIWARTGADGRYAVQGIPAGRWTATVHIDGQPFEVNFDVGTGQHASADIAIEYAP